MASVTVKWKKMGPEFTYNVLYSGNINGPYEKANETLLTDEYLSSASYGDENEYTIADLKDNTEYFFKVTCNDRYYQWWYSYSGVDSIEGGQGSSFNRPNPSEGNHVCFQVDI